jgi:hypothetical protein
MPRARWFLVALMLSVGACSLDLDAGLLTAADAGKDAPGGAGGGGGASGSSGKAGGTSDAGACSTASDCASGGCVEGDCVAGRCVYAVCPPEAACEARTCDENQGRCSSALEVTFHSHQLDVPQALGCGGNAARCIAALDRYVFVGTADGLVAWRVDNPLAPEPVSVDAPPFAVMELVASADRVLVIGPTAAGKLSLAWIDPPDTATPERILPSVLAVGFSNAFNAVHPATAGGFFLVKHADAEFHPAGVLALPVSAGATLTLFPSTGIPAGALPVAASGTRLVSYRADSSTGIFDPAFSLENQAGTASAQNAGEQLIGTAAGEASPTLGAHAFTSGFEGSVLWSTNRLNRIDSATVVANGVVLRWPLLGASDTSFSGARSVVIESYSDYGIDTQYFGPSALIDETTVLTTAADPANTAQTAVRAVTRSADTLELRAARYVLPFSVGQLGVTSNRHYGYVLTPSTAVPPSPPDAKLHLFAARCD